MVHAENISATTPVIEYQGISIVSVTKVESPNYLFINLVIAEYAPAGSFEIQFKNKKKVTDNNMVENSLILIVL